MKFGTVKHNGHTYKFIWIVELFDEAFKCDSGAKLWRYVVTDAELLCVEFCMVVSVSCLCKLFILLLTNVREVGRLAIPTSCLNKKKSWTVEKNAVCAGAECF
jgi:hypothetical protein